MNMVVFPHRQTYALQLLHRVVMALLGVVEDKVGHIDVVVWCQLGLIELGIARRDGDWNGD